jgi:hypothetical protein
MHAGFEFCERFLLPSSEANRRRQDFSTSEERAFRLVVSLGIRGRDETRTIRKKDARSQVGDHTWGERAIVIGQKF